MFSQYQRPKPEEEETGDGCHHETMLYSRSSSKVQRQRQPDHEDKATELIDAFAVTIQSLVDDSTTLCQMSSLIDHVMTTSTTGTGEVETGRSLTKKKKNTLDDFQGLEEWVTGLEEKVVALQELIKEEQQALDTIVECKLVEEAERQASVVSHLMTLLNGKIPPSSVPPRTPQQPLGHHKQNDDEEDHQQERRRTAVAERAMKQPPSTTSTSTDTSARSRALMPKSVNLPAAARAFTPQRSSQTPRKQETSFNDPYDDGGDDGYNDDSQLVYHDGETIDAADDSLYLDKNDDEEDHDGEVKLHAASLFVLPRVSREELNDKLSSLRIGRLSVVDVNEALEEIEEICLQKQQESSKFFFHHHHNTASRSSSSSNHSNNHGGGGSSTYYLSNAALQRKYEYLMRQRNMTYDHSNVGGTGAAGTTGIDTEALQSLHEGKTCWVTEQELREHCAFFRHGESTARATLTLLCSLRRLKQVPGRNRATVTYICLSSPSSSSSSINTTTTSTPSKYAHY